MAELETVRDIGWKLTAYCNCDRCNDIPKTKTESGHIISENDHQFICAAPKDIPFGTEITITGGWNGKVRVEERADGVIGKRLDIFQKDHASVIAFGVKNDCNIEYQIKMAKLS
ncbi:uncharacterized protein MONOS_8230 [Monocercomonoides exilis]|uniref:uncharacterized protein n=1 Tax=Monocercomonoides exilis TaxID=2049356 RepID=UPI00355AA1BB|nr:hypothetical protein MONOS_8230 [Monocercomonoides exilis]|eukprot:MONOS_8230.1-p1 / transcript=MONOS_8230.1 / gene=MONOS_8230 / organism=Monocercomonoides_exilis_PA203 / gene_product=unspecified product / transcript_product=unspecified product / location=Mono_scaffold00304:55759-56165(-) / protein_length=114 / sequence_SO=supercontig / SO=protein_coding / is_pseudo=false